MSDLRRGPRFPGSGNRMATADGVRASLEYLYSEARKANLTAAAPIILDAAEAIRRETTRLREGGLIEAGLIAHNITVAGRRTSVRLEPEMWDALREMAHREGVGINDICNEVALRRGRSTLTAALRVYVLSYFRAAATELGHSSVGHGVVERDLERRSGRRAEFPAET